MKEEIGKKREENGRGRKRRDTGRRGKGVTEKSSEDKRERRGQCRDDS